MIGTALGPYQVVAKLGEGGMGEVWKAYDAKLQRTVAIKVLHDTADAAHRILAEARAASALNHPHICTIHDVGDAAPSTPSTGSGQAGSGQAVSFIVMEYVEGKPLRELIPADGLPPGSVIRYGTQIADALAHAHAHHIVHRDLKSANVVITPDGRAKVLDFGVAEKLPDAEAATKTHEASSYVGMLVGTLAYMAPEVLAGEPATSRSDIWALGVLLYEMASGRLPFDGTTQTAVIAAVVKDEPEALPSSASAGLRTVVQRCLQKDPGQRYGHSAAVHAALEAIQSGTADAASSAAVVPVASAATSIAVLPFTNMSADPEQDYFSDGLTDEVIADLSGIRALRVISRTSAMRFKGTDKDLRTVARELNVRYVLQGSVRRVGANLRVTAQLVDPETDSNIWAHKYSGTTDDVFAIQEEMSRKIVDALQMQLSPEENKKLAERPFDNVEAFECYHRARQQIYTFSEQGLDRAIELIDEAAAIVGDHELLHATKGAVYFQYVNAALKDDHDYIELAEESARRVFALKPDSPHGLALLGLVRLSQSRQPESVRLFKRALALDPHSWYATVELGRIYECAGRFSEARTQHSAGLSVDPLSPILRGALLSNEMMAGHNDIALRELPAMVQAAPPFGYLRYIYALSLIAAGRVAEAIAVLEAMPEEPAPTIAGRCCVFLKLALEGRREEAATSIGEAMLRRARRVEWWSGWIAECYAFIDDHDQALDWLENAAQRGYFPYPYIATHSTGFRRLDGNVRFRELLGRIKSRSEQFTP